MVRRTYYLRFTLLQVAQQIQKPDMPVKGCRANQPPTGRYRAFKVTTKPKVAHMKDTIQNLTTMRDSGQPSFSKWW